MFTKKILETDDGFAVQIYKDNVLIIEQDFNPIKEGFVPFTEVEANQYADNEILRLSNQPVVTLDFVRKWRTEELFKTDWTQLVDAPLIEEEKEEYRVYRQQLRDLPATIDLFNPIYPSMS